MCGIDGFFGRASVDTTAFYQAHLLLKHRGPDDEGFLAGDGSTIRSFRGDDSNPSVGELPHILELGNAEVVLGHRRLSIIDLTEQGHQPFLDPSGRYALVYNGEIFNYLELRKDLESLGHEFRSDSDTEVFLHSYMEWGSSCFQRFNGMWAATIWDMAEHRIVLSRDHFGIKPLYYCLRDGTLFFASEMRFLRKFAMPVTRMKQAAAADYLYRTLLSHSKDTFYEGIYELDPGSYLSYDGAHAPAVTEFWDYQPTSHTWTARDAVERFGELFNDSLRLRMRSDVEAGSLLSGGLDSSLIVCALDSQSLISREMGFNTFSGVFEEPQFNEQTYIDSVLERVSVRSHRATPDADDLDAIVDRLLHRLEEPFRSLSPALQLAIYGQVEAETQVKVLLNGQGADEMFGGYTKHYYLHIAELARRGRVFAAVQEARELSRYRGMSLESTIRTARRRAREYSGTRDLFNAVTFREITHSPLREYLKYDDRTSMTYSLEARPPFLDRRLVEFAFGLSSDLKIRGIESKWVEREYARRLVPEQVVDRTDKMGFVTPQPLWQRNQLRRQIESAVDNLDELLAVGTKEEAAWGRQRFMGYLNEENEDWTFAWRVSCLGRWTQTVL